MRITSKGQVTIPIKIREQTGFLPNTEVEFVVDGLGVRLVKTPNESRRKPSRGEEMVQRLRGTGKRELTTDKILRLMRGDD